MNKTVKLIIAVVLATVPVVVAILLLTNSPGQQMPQARNAPAQPPATGGSGAGTHEQHTAAGMRTLTLNDGREPAPSRSAEQLRAAVIAGAMPREEMLATVMTDEDCEPDTAGVSHCKNRLKLENGRSLTVRHPHKMSDIPCMSPGEKIHIIPMPRA